MSEEELEDENYKNLLIVNESEDWRITLYIYSGFSPICKFSTISKIILPKQKYMHRDESVFSFELVAIREDEQKKKETKKLLGPLEWTREKLIRITESLECRQENYQDFVNEKRVCLREINREKELATACGGSNLYDILALDMEEIRKMERSAADIEIERAYRKQIRIWHPDKNFGDCEIATQIIVAKEILLDPARRASYHNAVDYDEGWFSRERWKSILTPERCTEEQNRAFRYRIFMSVISAGVLSGGVVLSVGTAGAATPSLFLCGAVLGGGCTFAGVDSLMYTVRKECIVDGCEWKKWALEAGKGFAFGGATAGVAAGRLAVKGVEVAVEAGQKATGKVILAGIKSLPRNAALAVPGNLVKSGSKAAIEFGKERVDDSVENQHPIKHVKDGLANAVTDTVLNTGLHGVNLAMKTITGQPIAEGPKLSNQEKVKKHVLDSLEQVMEDGVNIAKEIVFASKKGSDDYAHGSKESDETKESSSTQPKPDVIREELEATSESRSGESCEENRKLTADEPQEGTIIYISEGAWIARNICSGDYADGSKESEESNSTQQILKVIREKLTNEPRTWTIKYISEGAWFSKMIVTFSLNGKEGKVEVSGDKKRVEIPAGATQIQVRFQVSRPLWGDIMKYDRFKKTWCEPSKPHVFRYKEPVDRTFTLSGSLWYEAVMRVNDEYHEETKEMN